MRELEGAPLDVAAAATGAAVALGVVGGVTAALTRRRPASSAREGDGVKGESSRGHSRAKTANELSTAAASASIARAPFLVLLAIAAVLLAAEHARRGWGAPLDPLDVRGALSAIERLAPPASRADVRPECARVSAFPDLFGAHGHPEGFPEDVPVGGLRLDFHAPARDPRLARARQHFSQGLALKFGFNREEARRHFLAAARLARGAGRDCAACLWGIAFSLHPDVNDWRTRRGQRAAGRVAAASAAALASRDVAAARDAGDARREAAAAKTLVLADAEAAFFGTNVFDHPLGSTAEDPNDALGHPDGELAQADAHYRYLRVLEMGIEALAPETAASAKEKDFSRIKENLRAAWTRTDDPDLLAVLGEACMNLTPWQYWNWTLPAPGPSTDEQYVEVRESKGARAQDAFAALTKALSADASHPLAAHALVHLTESLPIRNARFAGIEPGGDALSSDDGSDGSDGRVVKRDSTGTYPRASLNPSLRSGKDALRDVAASPRLGEAAADALFASFAKKSPTKKNTTRAGVSPHLAHMAAHTYARVGRFRSAVDASLAATRADDALTRGCVWPYGEAHNRAMLVAAAAAASSGPEGERVAFAAAADPGTADNPSGFLDQHAGFLTAFHDVPKLLVAARFGRWRSVLRLAAEAERRAVNEALAPQFGTAKKTKTSLKSAKRLKKLPADFDGLAVAERWTDLVSSTPYGRAQWAYVMGLAASRAFVDAERADDSRFRIGTEGMDEGDDAWIAAAAAAKISPERWLAHLRNLAASPEISDFDEHTVVPGVSARGGAGAFHAFSPFRHVKKRLALIAAHVLGGALHARAGEWDEAIESLAAAAAVHDSLPYMEPEHWYAPPKLCLGEAQLRAGKPRDALRTFAGELRDARPNDAWATEGERRARERVEAGEDVSPAESEDGTTSCFEVFP